MHVHHNKPYSNMVRFKAASSWDRVENKVNKKKKKIVTMETIRHIQSCLQNRKLNQYYGGTGKYLARSHDVRTERNEVRVS